MGSLGVGSGKYRIGNVSVIAVKRDLNNHAQIRLVRCASQDLEDLRLAPAAALDMVENLFGGVMVTGHTYSSWYFLTPPNQPFFAR